MLTNAEHAKLFASFVKRLQVLLGRVATAYAAASKQPIPVGGASPLLAAEAEFSSELALAMDRILSAAATTSLGGAPLSMPKSAIMAALSGSTAEIAAPLSGIQGVARSVMRNLVVEATLRPVSIGEASTLVSKRLSLPVAQARTLANTGISAVGREVQVLAAAELRRLAEPPVLIYTGPSGGPIRPFCQALVGKALTLDQISQLDNGQGLSVIRYGGGYNCRHGWTAVPRSGVTASRSSFATTGDVSRANRGA